MRDRIFFLLVASGIVFTIGFFTQCELLIGGEENVNVTIELWNSLDETEGSARAITNQPPGIVSYTVTVTAPDIQTIQKTISSTTQYVNMYIPAGKSRTIRLDANLDPQSLSVLYSYAGETTADLYPGKIIRLRFLMTAGRTKLVIPDYGSGGTAKLVQIPDMTPLVSEWMQLTQVFDTGTGGNLSLQPWEVDFDSQGRIFINDAAPCALVRIDYFDPLDSTPDAVVRYFTSMNCFAIDRLGDTLYYNDYATLYRNDLDFTTQTMPTAPTGITGFTSMKFENGILYILGSTAAATSVPTLFRYETTAGTTTHRYFQTGGAADPYFDSPRDILIKGDYVYVTNWTSAKIARFTKNTLTPLAAYGMKTSSDDDRVPGHFYGPHHFIAPTNRKFYIIDDGDASINADRMNRIVSFEDLETWSGWETFAGEDIDPGYEFRFYQC